jgi:hypothetical protein
VTMPEPAGISTKQPIAIRPSMPSRCVSVDKAADKP